MIVFMTFNISCVKWFFLNTDIMKIVSVHDFVSLYGNYNHSVETTLGNYRLVLITNLQ